MDVIEELKRDVRCEEWWLVSRTAGGLWKNLEDGPHGSLAEVNQAAYLHAKLFGVDLSEYAAAKVTLYSLEPNDKGVNAEAVDQCKAMLAAAQEGL